MANPLARLANEAGGYFQGRGRLAGARIAYAITSRLSPRWSAGWFNRGLIAKFERNWPDSRAFNRRAAELDPNDPPSWWNLGIAATALGDWETAREAWSRYGIEVPEGSGPIEMELGPVPIRVAPDANPEVVWCDRLDPARAVIRNIPTPDSGRGCGDLVLHDGEPRGHRMLGDQEVPVFDELQVLAAGTLHTFLARVVARSRSDVEALETGPGAGDLTVEDWESSIQMLCRDCSEGRPHEGHPHSERPGWKPERKVAIAARSEAEAREALTAWIASGPGRELSSIECVLRRS